MKISALNRKLLRDLAGMKSQAIAIALVIASGVAMFVMFLSNFESLRRTQEIYYGNQRFADIFATAKRVPERVADRLAAIPGVSVIDTRVVADVTLDLPDMDEPSHGRLISLPAEGRPALNDVFLRRGRWIDPSRADEVLASEAFALAHGFEPGAEIAAIINGRKRILRIVGIALSPEYIYAIPPGEIIPDDRRFGILWMERKALAAAFNMEGGFNNVTLRLMPGASSADVIAELDRELASYGGLGAIPRSLQLSHWTIDSELRQLQTFGLVVPALFLGVAVFILNIALKRAMALQRPQIAAMKALGYTTIELAWHYLKWAIVISAAGAVAGTAAGAYLGSGMIELYNQYFRFPELDYRLSTGVAAGAVLGSLLIAALGALSSVGRAVRIPPAEAMRPEPPARYHVSLIERGFIGRRLSHATRMILRNLHRRPLRAAASLAGISLAAAILVVGLFLLDAMDVLKEMQFYHVQRQDVTVTFVEAASARALHELGAMPGVMNVEPMRSAPVRLRHGHRSRNLVVVGLPSMPSLNRIVDRSGKVYALPPEGLLMSKTLAGLLGTAPGDVVRLEVLEGSRPVRETVVAGLVDEFIGLSVYMDKQALHRLLREDEKLSGAYLQVDAGETQRLYRKLKSIPAVAGVSLTEESLRSFERTMAENMGVMTTIIVFFAFIIAFGVVYNTARVSLSERSQELASLRVLGFRRNEISVILLGELALLTVMALPLGAGTGYVMAEAILAAVENELYRIPLVITAQNLALSSLAVIAAAAFSGLAVRRKLDRLDLIAVLKIRE
ncbi:MAG TPA: ABC transporter permease [Acidobacteriota bacterium]|nr:ABC transporter permease [Acidobacteriota bacterium]